MEVLKLSLNDKLVDLNEVSCCIGYFDGLHLGHKALVDKTIDLACQLNCKSGIISFDPDPWVTIKKIQGIKHITTMEQRIKIAEKMNLDYFYILDFSEAMSALEPDAFLDFLVQNLNLKALVCGFDFHYGKAGKGNCSTLNQYADQKFIVECVDSVNDDHGKISSSRIVECIENGDLVQAHLLLDYPYTITGFVIHGNAKGKSELGFPTANVGFDAEFILPKLGVYAGLVTVKGNTYRSMINIGFNPTFNERKLVSIEAHILDFNQDIYGEAIQVEFYKYIRSEMKFSSINDLIEQLNKDLKEVNQVFDHE